MAIVVWNVGLFLWQYFLRLLRSNVLWSIFAEEGDTSLCRLNPLSFAESDKVFSSLNDFNRFMYCIKCWLFSVNFLFRTGLVSWGGGRTVGFYYFFLFCGWFGGLRSWSTGIVMVSGVCWWFGFGSLFISGCFFLLTRLLCSLFFTFKKSVDVTILVRVRVI